MKFPTMGDLDDLSFDGVDGPVTEHFARSLAENAHAPPSNIVSAELSYQRARQACEDQGRPELAHRAGVSAVVVWGMRQARSEEDSLRNAPAPDAAEIVSQNLDFMQAIIATLAIRNGGTLTIERADVEATQGRGCHQAVDDDRVTFRIEDA